MPLPFSGSRQTFPGAQRASLGGPAKDARARRGEPGAAGGGGRPRARAAGARGSRRGMGPAAAAGRAARPPAGPAALPAPSRLPLASAAARRAGARRAARNCFHCKQKKATHDQAGGGEARGGRGAEGAEGAGERENVGRAASGLGRRARTRRGGPCPRPSRRSARAPPLPGRSRAWPRRFAFCGTAGRGWRARAPRPWAAGLLGRRRAARPLPRAPATRRAGVAPLAACHRNASTPSASLTWLESKTKENHGRARLARRGTRIPLLPDTASWRDSQGRPPALLQRPPRAPGEAQRHRSLPPRWPLLRSSAGARLPEEGGWPLLTTEQEARPRPCLRASPVGCAQPLTNF